MNDFLERYYNMIHESKTILKDDSYMTWLEKFTELYPMFADSSWTYSPEKISKEDNNNVLKLSSLFEAIDRFAEANNIPISKDSFSRFYAITFNDITYELGVISGQGIVFYCERSEPRLNAISFNDIVQGKQSPNVQQINAIFDNICESIYRLNNEFSLSTDMISKRITNIIRNIESQY